MGRSFRITTFPTCLGWHERFQILARYGAELLPDSVLHGCARYCNLQRTPHQIIQLKQLDRVFSDNYEPGGRSRRRPAGGHPALLPITLGLFEFGCSADVPVSEFSWRYNLNIFVARHSEQVAVATDDDLGVARCSAGKKFIVI